MPRFQQFLRALAIIIAIAMGIVALWSGRFLPGAAGEFFQSLFRLLTTPIILEISFFGLGLLIVMALAHYQETRHNEWVEMDIPVDVDEKNSPQRVNTQTDPS